VKGRKLDSLEVQGIYFGWNKLWSVPASRSRGESQPNFNLVSRNDFGNFGEIMGVNANRRAFHL
jgi:hypothetical protein